MLQMNCIIVDDEPLAQQLIEDFVKAVPFLNLVSKCSSAFEAFSSLRDHSIDLVFLDIHMPNVSGIDFINSIETRPMFIFTTAYSEHALEGFNLNALDYLLKPIPFDRFLKAVNKAFDLFSLRKARQAVPVALPENQLTEKYILVKTDYQTVKVNLDEILYVEGLKDYVKIYLTGGKLLVTLNSLKHMAEKFPNEHFVRVHKSFIISVSKITSITRNRIIINGKWIPVGESFKEDFNAALKKNHIEL